MKERNDEVAKKEDGRMHSLILRKEENRDATSPSEPQGKTLLVVSEERTVFSLVVL